MDKCNDNINIDKPINIYFISDLHLEFFEKVDVQFILETYLPLLKPNNRNSDLLENVIHSNNDKNILLLAGDICTAKRFQHFIFLFEEIIKRGWFDNIYYIAGNHEYYGTRLDKAHLLIKESISKSEILNDVMIFLHDNVVQLNDKTQLIATPMWFSVPVVEEFAIQQKMNDFRKIEIKIGNDSKARYRKINYNDIALLHAQQTHFIKQALIKGKENGLKSIVLTHHSPSTMVINNTKWQYDLSSVLGYATNLEQGFYHDEVGLDNIIKWIHGHTHHPRYKHYVSDSGASFHCYQNTVGYPMEMGDKQDVCVELTKFTLN